CGPCKMMAPIVGEIADAYAGKAKICKLDTDEARDSAMEFGISAIPTVILFKGGEVEKKWVGLTSKKDMTDAIDELL
ncbi:MAG: thioredoxin, partial [Planctomycetes bacterium]|nr:thioredoxin [Planctomycetota bacterium]